MKTLFATLTVLLLQGTLSTAQTALPYVTGFDNTTQKAGWQEFRKGNADPNYKWIYNTFASYSAPACLSHNYPVGGSVATDDWFVSPSFAIPAGGRVDSIRSAFSGFGVPYTNDTVAVYILKGSPDPALATSKILLFDYRGSDYSNDNTWTSHTFTLAPVTGTCYLAIKYKTVNNWLDVKFDNIRLSANGSTSMSKSMIQQQTVMIYPNPASDKLRIKFDHPQNTPALIKLYNTLGELQIEQKMMENETLHFNLKNGTYFYTLVADDGRQLKSGKLMVQTP